MMQVLSCKVSDGISHKNEMNVYIVSMKAMSVSFTIIEVDGVLTMPHN